MYFARLLRRCWPKKLSFRARSAWPQIHQVFVEMIDRLPFDFRRAGRAACQSWKCASVLSRAFS